MDSTSIAAADFDSFMASAWAEHADQPEAVIDRLMAAGPTLLRSEADLMTLSRLAHHLHGEHLGRWDDGIQCQQVLATLSWHQPEGDSGAALRRHMAALRLAGQGTLPGNEAGASEQVRITAMAAASLVGHDTARAAALFNQALARFDQDAMPHGDPATRALAVTANNLACELEERTQRSAEDRALMLLAAQAARRFWALAGGWLETERAEYRLSCSWRLAGDPVRAMQHARACLAIVAEHGQAPLERFFGHEALALAAAAAGEVDATTSAVAAAEVDFAALPADDQVWCRATLDRLPR